MKLKTTIKNISDFYKLYPEYKGQINVKTRFGYKKIEEAKITAYNEQIYKLIISNSTLLASKNHKLLSNNKWIKIKNLNPGDYIETINGRQIIIDIKETNVFKNLYDLQVKDVKEFYANGIVSHNSTIADALFFGLFGTTIRELNKEDIVNNINKSKCRVKVSFDVIEDKYVNECVIERGILPNKLYVEINGADATKSTIPKTTEEICNIIGANQDIFKNAVIMTVNGTTPFMAQKKVEKRKFCEGLFNLEVFQNMLLEGRKLYNDVKNDLEIQVVKHDEVNNTVSIYNDQKRKTDEYRNARRLKLTDRNENNIEELKTLKTSLKLINMEDIEKHKSNITLLEKYAKQIKDDMQKHVIFNAKSEEKINAKVGKINALKLFGDICDKCERPFSETDKTNCNEKIKLIISEIEIIKGEMTQHKQDQITLEETYNKCLSGIEKAKNSINEIHSNVEFNKNVCSRMEQLNTWNKQIKIDLEALEEDKNDFDTLLNDNSTRLNSLKDIIKSLNNKLLTLDSIKHIVSEEGVKSFIIKKLLKLLNGKLSYYLNKLDAPCKFKFNEYFDEHIINEKGQECSYNNFSSGERKRIDLAILFTFMDIRRLQGNISINIAFYDEILDTSLDNKGIEAFLEIINERIDKYNESCYIISHKTTAISSNINEVIFLEKRNGFTTIGKNN